MNSKKDQARLDALHNMPCICCVSAEQSKHYPRGTEQPNRTTAHHLVDKGNRKASGGHQATIPLCEWHHQGYPLELWLAIEMKAKWGPSLELHKREFIATYGTERFLLKETNELLGDV
jgi:hypothetical protein